MLCILPTISASDLSPLPFFIKQTATLFYMGTTRCPLVCLYQRPISSHFCSDLFFLTGHRNCPSNLNGSVGVCACRRAVVLHAVHLNQPWTHTVLHSVAFSEGSWEANRRVTLRRVNKNDISMHKSIGCIYRGQTRLTGSRKMVWDVIYSELVRGLTCVQLVLERQFSDDGLGLIDLSGNLLKWNLKKKVIY